MAKSKPRTQKLSNEIIAAYHEAGQKGDVAEFKRLLGKYAAHLPNSEKEAMIEEFKRHAEVLRSSLRK
jgi:hypothetical protein